MDRSITIRNLPKNVYVPELCDHFKCFGNIISAAVYCNDILHPTGEACIEFDKSSSALNAVKFKKNFILNNRPLDISLSIENHLFKKVFIRNMNPEWDVCDLLKAFEDIGTVETVKISENDGQSNGYGFVEFSNHSLAKKAIERMNGKKIDGYELVVERFRNKYERDNLMQNSLEHVEKMLKKSVQKNNLYIKNLPPDLTEEQLQKIFGKFGEIISLKIAVDDKGISKQFGFVCYKDEENAQKALRRMNGFTLNDKKLQINFKEDRQLRKKYNALKFEEQNVKIKQYKQKAQSLTQLLPHPSNHKGKSDSSKKRK